MLLIAGVELGFLGQFLGRLFSPTPTSPSAEQAVPGVLSMRDGTRLVVSVDGLPRHGEFRGAAPDGSYSVQLDGESALRAFEVVYLEPRFTDRIEPSFDSLVIDFLPMADDRIVCEECDWKGRTSQTLSANHPFKPGEALAGCPKCRAINSMVVVCDEPGCWKPTNCGTPTPTGYRSTCIDHAPWRTISISLPTP